MTSSEGAERITLTESPRQPLVHGISASQTIMTKKILLAAALIILAGVGSGYLLSRNSTNSSTPTADRTGSPGQPSNEKAVRVVGSADTKSFPDNTEGTLREGGIDGEGTHNLERPGGPSQTVYLTSSILDLSEFVGKRVRVWGQTHAAKKAGWLMDVGKVEVL